MRDYDRVYLFRLRPYLVACMPAHVSPVTPEVSRTGAITASHKAASEG